MEINQNPLEFLTAKVQETVAETQNLAHQIAANVEETATVVTTFIQSAPSSIVSAGAIATQEAFKVAHNIRFENLPTTLQFKFATVGVRDGIRNIQEAAKVFESIPAQIRAQGPEAIRNFRQGKDWSHIQAHVNGGGSEAANGIFEHFRVNRVRGGVDMTAAELAVAKQVLADAAFKAAVAEVVGAALKGAIAAAVIELVFSILENSLLCVEGKITQSELVEQVATATAKAGIAGGVITAILLTLCMIFPPIAALLGATTIPLAIAGIGFMGIRAWEIFCHGDRIFGITEQTQKFLGMTEATTEVKL
ncbi:MAG: hypothetical protein QQW96_05040 [Tychonema bourrellyi B0820]|uniref:Uncharacterized protein n=1 Tax=Tychonema bourrellyi FEM_GT703 TaxID=2040638 RepID=A0A2G4F0J4_9CYAN|nr:hypothetical protein [Tychonema bourrellyi]MDQ2096996.1 hypothetical protein [Tychonema bourrellyi B0820]PHX55275.1 hypothetical protein CP500_011550 [Tychonema bourrellyi FEM_GT703]